MGACSQKTLPLPSFLPPTSSLPLPPLPVGGGKEEAGVLAHEEAPRPAAPLGPLTAWALGTCVGSCDHEKPGSSLAKTVCTWRVSRKTACSWTVAQLAPARKATRDGTGVSGPPGQLPCSLVCGTHSGTLSPTPRPRVEAVTLLSWARWGCRGLAPLLAAPGSRCSRPHRSWLHASKLAACAGHGPCPQPGSGPPGRG